MKTNKMAAVRELLATNPDISPDEIVKALGKQKIRITAGVASNYKSVIKNSSKRGKKKGRRAKVAWAAESEGLTLATALPVKASSGAHASGLDADVVGLLKAGQKLGWKKVRSIAELMAE